MQSRSDEPGQMDQTPVEFHILPDHGDGWLVSCNGVRVARFDARQEAIEDACDRAQREDSSIVVFHDRAGHITERTS